MKMPLEVTQLDTAFGGDMQKLLPSMSEIPAEFTSFRSKWCDFINDLFCVKISVIRIKPREGIDERQALRHIKAIIVSYQPDHGHKIAGCAYLMSLWFEDDFSYIRRTPGRK